MSMSSEFLDADDHDVLGRPRRGPRLWLWLLILYLIFRGLFEAFLSLDLLVMALTFPQYLPHGADETLANLLWSALPAVGCLCAAAFLIWWRRARGLNVAVAMLWAVPVSALLQLIVQRDIVAFALMERPPHQWARFLYETDFMGAVGCSAFLLGVPQIRALFRAPVAASGAGSRWLWALIGLLLLALIPVVTLAVEVGTGYSLYAHGSAITLDFEPFQAEAVIGLLLIACGILLAIWRRGVSISVSLAVLWLLLLLAWSKPLLHHVLGDLTRPITAADHWRFNLDFWSQVYGSASVSYGISLFMTIGWSAYLLSSPAIRSRYPRKRETQQERQKIDAF